MKLIGITNRGLAVIALLVGLLWGMIFAERALTYRAQRDYIELRRSTPPQPEHPQPARSPRALPASQPAEA